MNTTYSPDRTLRLRGLEVPVGEERRGCKSEISLNIQSNFNGSNIFGTIKISSRQG